MRRLVAFLGVTLSFMGLCSCVSYDLEDRSGVLTKEGFPALLDLRSIVLRFDSRYGRWPTTADELAELAATDERSMFDSAAFSDLVFFPQPNGGLRVVYVLAPPGTGHGRLLFEPRARRSGP